ncbi:MAG TPA: serine hydrolase domain-containing protein [Thermoanaerobaculia bacterium]|nr:serine hydrolase domain-containing protein [Thermoanaerobaculia bacterium]
MRLAGLAVLFLLAAPAVRGDAIDDYAREQMERMRFPGLALAVVRDGAVVTTRMYGSADLAGKTPVKAETVFELGSISKQFTAMAVMMLVEDGKIALDASIANYLPDVPEPWRRITVRHLLTHSSGIREYLSDPELAKEVHGAADHAAVARILMARLPLDFDPGATWAYSNSGYLLLGHIVERASGTPYWDFLKARIFEPAGMRSTRSSDPNAKIRNRATGYGWTGERFEARPPVPVNAFAAGAIVSTIQDMAKWEAALHAGRFLKKESFEAMWTPLRLAGGATPPFSYGFGWVVDAHHGGTVVLHSGGTPGFSSAIRRHLRERVTVILLANHGDRIIDPLALDIAGLADPALARRRSDDPDLVRTARHLRAIRDLLTGRGDPELFTPAMQLFLSTPSGRGLLEWIGSHGPLRALTYAESERVGLVTVHRYRARLGDARVWFSVAMSDAGAIAQIYWW